MSTAEIRDTPTTHDLAQPSTNEPKIPKGHSTAQRVPRKRFIGRRTADAQRETDAGSLSGGGEVGNIGNALTSILLPTNFLRPGD